MIYTKDLYFIVETKAITGLVDFPELVCTKFSDAVMERSKLGEEYSAISFNAVQSIINKNRNLDYILGERDS